MSGGGLFSLLPCFTEWEGFMKQQRLGGCAAIGGAFCTIVGSRTGAVARR